MNLLEVPILLKYLREERLNFSLELMISKSITHNFLFLHGHISGIFKFCAL